MAPWVSVPASPDPPPAKVILLAGPSGCGKTHLATESGLPLLPLDDFYRDDTAPDLPRTEDGRVDWEDVGSWDLEGAVAAVTALCRGDEVTIPRYSFAENRRVEAQTIRRDGSPIVLAEGIFAADLVAPLDEAGLLADALLICENRWLTFVRRLGRDLREGRKAPAYLVRQGWAKTRSHRDVVDRLSGLGARLANKREARRVLGSCVSPSVEGEVVGPAGIEPATKAL